MASLLVVDDELDILSSLEMVLQMEGYEVYTAYNGKFALELLEKVVPSLILTDLMMPVMSGYELIRQVKANPNWKSLPLVAMSAGWPATGGSSWDFFLRKPIDLDLLLETIERFAKKK